MGAALAAVLLLAPLGGCQTLFGPPTVTESQTAAQAELAFTALEKGLHDYLVTAKVSADTAKKIGFYNTKVYEAIVAVRNAAENNNSVAGAAAMTAFKDAVAGLKDYVNSNGGRL